MTPASSAEREQAGGGSGASWFYNPRVRGIVFQVLVVAFLLGMLAFFAYNAKINLERAGIASGLGFLSERAGFDISQSLVPYTNDSSYFRAFLVGLLNTLLVAAIGIVIATVLGFIVGIARLSKNFLIRQLATWYVELLRNIPLLLQLLFWYKAVLSVLPSPRQSLEPVSGVYLNNRGLILPEVIGQPGSSAILWALLAAVAASIGISRWARKRQQETGRQFPSVLVGLGLIVGLPLLVFLVTGMPVELAYAELAGFNFRGGVVVIPEFMALLLGLALYTAAFIAEIVRAGILAVSHGQTEAAYSLGLRPRRTLQLVIIPQAMRVIIPPLTSQYLNLTKNSSLAVAIGYPDLVAVFAGTVLNQTGQAVEVIIITMLVYLTLSLLTSGFMNWYNSRMALVER
ncbi:amino acid ABC transporter permease [Stappia indica]|uniref:amino acid ABC transporter permease n=1 Tax=Stappia indica TaxID=538381 RepID=UPI00083552A6|nr:amino acid ABC transporter permease [Stappia indica]MCC4246984.1 amino acid ABC transporter permease [Stappia indica]